jgi:hypothetical protein
MHHATAEEEASMVTARRRRVPLRRRRVPLRRRPPQPACCECMFLVFQRV